MKKSTTFAIFVMFAGYAIASYGWVLIKGWNIPFKAWINPLDAYRWPASGIPDLIPPGQLFPSSTPTDTAGPFPKVDLGAVLNPVGATVAPVNGQCPAGYTLQNGKCVSLRTASGLH